MLLHNDCNASQCMSQCHWCLPAQYNRESHLNFIELCIPIPTHDLSGLVCPVRHLLKFKIEFYQFLSTSLKQRYHLSHQKRSATPKQTTLNTSQFWRQQRIAPSPQFHLTINSMYSFMDWTHHLFHHQTMVFGILHLIVSLR